MRLFATFLLIGVLILIGVGVYNAGVSAGLATTGAAVASGAPAVYYGPYVGHPYGWGGFGFFGIFFLILGFFLIFGLIRAIFGWGRWSGRDWGSRHGNGGHGGNGGRRDYFDDWHRRAHESADQPNPSSSSSGTGT